MKKNIQLLLIDPQNDFCDPWTTRQRLSGFRLRN